MKSWVFEEKRRFWEGDEEQEDRNSDGQRVRRIDEEKRRIPTAGERQTHQARDGMNSGGTPNCPSLANPIGCHLPTSIEKNTY